MLQMNRRAKKRYVDASAIEKLQIVAMRIDK